MDCLAGLGVGLAGFHIPGQSTVSGAARLNVKVLALESQALLRPAALVLLHAMLGQGIAMRIVCSTAGWSMLTVAPQAL